MAVWKCIEFKKEPTGPLPHPRAVIQGFSLEDLGGWTLPPPPGGTQFSNTAGLEIIPLPSTAMPGTQNQLFIGQGKVKVSPTDELLEEISEVLGKDVASFQVNGVAKHYYGPPGQPIVTAYDCQGNHVDSHVGSKAQGTPEKLILMAEEICHIVIHGTEAAIEKICFLFV